MKKIGTYNDIYLNGAYFVNIFLKIPPSQNSFKIVIDIVRDNSIMSKKLNC